MIYLEIIAVVFFILLFPYLWVSLMALFLFLIQIGTAVFLFLLSMACLIGLGFCYMCSGISWVFKKVFKKQ
jgi:hypothetical protein